MDFLQLLIPSAYSLDSYTFIPFKARGNSVSIRLFSFSLNSFCVSSCVCSLLKTSFPSCVYFLLKTSFVSCFDLSSPPLR